MGSYMGSPILRTQEKEVALSFLKQRAFGAFTEKDTHSINVVIPHLRNAMRLRERIEELATTVALSSELIERLAFGIAIIDSQLRVLLHNRSGEQWLKCLGPTWRWTQCDPNLQHSFKDIILTACQSENPTPARAM